MEWIKQDHPLWIRLNKSNIQIDEEMFPKFQWTGTDPYKWDASIISPSWASFNMYELMFDWEIYRYNTLEEAQQHVYRNTSTVPIDYN